MLRSRLVFPIWALALFTAACANATPTPAAALPTDPPADEAAPAASAALEIKLFSFKPEALEVTAGTTVVWTNQDNIGHSITAGTPPDPAGPFDSEFINQGESFSFTFEEAGEYHYFCRRHNSMTGVINVAPAAP